MTQYRKKPAVIDAVRWYQNGDHPDDDVLERVDPKTGEHSKTEGRVVRHFRHDELSGETHCRACGQILHRHGWIDTLEGGHIVCPGDWIITGTAGEHYPCKNRIFETIYEKVNQVLE